MNSSAAAGVQKCLTREKPIGLGAAAFFHTLPYYGPLNGPSRTRLAGEVLPCNGGSAPSFAIACSTQEQLKTVPRGVSEIIRD